MRLGIVGDLVTHSGSKGEYTTVFELSNQLAFQAQQHMTLCTPMIRNIPWQILNHTYTYIPKLLGPPKYLPFVGCLLNRFDLGPIGQGKRWLIHLHEIRDYLGRESPIRLANLD